VFINNAEADCCSASSSSVKYPSPTMDIRPILPEYRSAMDKKLFSTGTGILRTAERKETMDGLVEYTGLYSMELLNGSTN